MFKVIIEGNLGGNAELRNDNGHQFVSMSVAHTTRRTLEDGQVKESTLWVSATINGDGGNLLPYLVKGARVHIIGDGELRTYHSEKQRALVAGLKVFVREIELVGGAPEAVPRDLYDVDGVAHRIAKYYYCPDVRDQVLLNRGGEQFVVDANGWVSPTNVQQVPAATSDVQSEQNDAPQSSVASDGAQDAQIASGSKSSAKKTKK